MSSYLQLLGTIPFGSLVSACLMDRGTDFLLFHITFSKRVYTVNILENGDSITLWQRSGMLTALYKICGCPKFGVPPLFWHHLTCFSLLCGGTWEMAQILITLAADIAVSNTWFFASDQDSPFFYQHL